MCRRAVYDVLPCVCRSVSCDAAAVCCDARANLAIRFCLLIIFHFFFPYQLYQFDQILGSDRVQFDPISIPSDPTNTTDRIGPVIQFDHNYFRVKSGSLRIGSLVSPFLIFEFFFFERNIWVLISLIFLTLAFCAMKDSSAHWA